MCSQYSQVRVRLAIIRGDLALRRANTVETGISSGKMSPGDSSENRNVGVRRELVSGELF
jgi:hypothetical protein